MRRRSFAMLVIGLCLLAPAGGCGGPATATVGGEVTVGGVLLEKGVISFVPAEGEGAPATANVVNGRYEIRTTPGNKRVQVSAPVVVGKRPEYNGPNAPMVEITAEGLPDRYNAKSELTYEVKPGGNTKNWELEGKLRKP